MKIPAEEKETISVINYGCSANRAMAEGIMGILQENGHILTSIVDEADTIVVNTCVVKQNTEHKIKSQLLALGKTKNVIVTGCLPVVMRDWLTDHLPQAKVLFPEKADQIIEVLNNNPVAESRRVDPATWSQLYTTPRVPLNPIIAVIEISRGCLGTCSFCIVKQAKGSLRSRSPEQIKTEVHSALQAGAKEIWLTSQDVGAYGWDFKPHHYVPSLVEAITQLSGQFFIRLGMMTPETVDRFTTPLIEQLANPKVYSFLHLPIQSGSDPILRAMRRKETRAYFVDLVARLREAVPSLTLATDIIVGFPGETHEDYLATKELLKEIQPTVVNLSKYTDRVGTRAAVMPNKVPTKVKAQRSHELTRLNHQHTRQKLREWLGWQGPVLIDETGKHPRQMVGRNPSYVPVVFPDSRFALGDIVTAEIVDTGGTFLIGEV